MELKCAFIMSEEMYQTKPEGIDIIFDCGYVGVTPADERVYDTDMYTHGIGVIAKGSKKDFVEWLKPFPGIWFYEGPMMLENFKIRHVSEEAIEEINSL